MKLLNARSSYSIARAMRIAHMAGAGFSAGEIADEIGVSDTNIRAMLSEYRVPLVPKTSAQMAFPVVVSKSAMGEAQKIAARLKIDPYWMAGRLIEAVAEEPALALNLLDGVEAP